YDSSLNNVLSGRGTSSLVIKGVTVTIDATALSLKQLEVDNAFNADTSAPFTFTGLPGTSLLYDFHSPGTPAVFSLAADGTVGYDPALDNVSSGRGTSTLTVHGVTVTIDPRPLTASRPANFLFVDNGYTAPTNAPFRFTSLPGSHALEDNDGAGASVAFS